MFLFTVLLEILPTATTLNNGLAKHPPMGWRSWIGHGCNTDCKNTPRLCLSENLIKRTADRMVSDGYLDIGYEYIIVDDCWMDYERDVHGQLIGDRQRFQNGIKELANYVHSKGLKFGIYQSLGSRTCSEKPGSLFHEEQDVKTFAEWGVDYVRLDGCHYDYKKMEQGYTTYGKLMNATGRPMLYSCSWPYYAIDMHVEVNFTHVAKVCNTWRSYDDIARSWKFVMIILDWYAKRQDVLNAVAGPGHWHDLDQLLVGFKEVTKYQADLQLKAWVFLNLPLMIGCDLETIDDDGKQMLLNKNVLSLNGMPHLPGKRIYQSSNGQFDLWLRSHRGSSYLLLCVYRTNSPTLYDLVVKLEDLALPRDTYEVQDFATDRVLGKWDTGKPYPFLRNQISLVQLTPAAKQNSF